MERNRKILTIEEYGLMNMLDKNGQGHLFKDWPRPGRDDKEKGDMLRDLAQIDDMYPGGLVAYIDEAQRLFKDSLFGSSPYDGWTMRAPDGEKLEFGSDRYINLEAIGTRELRKTGFVMVSGDHGDRLGYRGVKVSLPLETTTNISYMEFFIKNILNFQEKARLRTKKRTTLPLAIVTSDETHQETKDFLWRNKNFGMEENQITLLKQGNVPAVDDTDGSFFLEAPYKITTKPHGHGDVHILMHKEGVAKRWVKYMGIKWIFFFEDTNGPALRGLPAALGLSKENEFAMNYLTVPRKSSEMIDGIAKFVDGKRVKTVNLGYNHLDPLLLDIGFGTADVADESGFSPYPASCNSFVLETSTYFQVLESTKGVVPESVYPKYKNDKKFLLEEPTTLECEMQDYSKLLRPEEKVGVTQAERFYCYSPVNNSTDDALLAQETSYAQSAATGEFDIYKSNRKYLQHSGVKFEPDKIRQYSGISVPYNARIVLQPSFGTTLQEVRNRIYGDVSISANSTLILDGDIEIYNLKLDGALEVYACSGAKVTIRNLTVKNDGWGFRAVDPNDGEVDEEYRIRGFALEKHDKLDLRFEIPGLYVIDDKTRLKTVLIPKENGGIRL